MIHALEPQLEGGHVAVVSSMFSLASGGINYSTYAASKGAIYHYVSSLRQEYKKDGRNITVSLACPYAINTGMFHGFSMAIEYVVPVLDEAYVGRRMVREFVGRKEVCFMYQYAGWVLRLLEMMPSQVYDWMWIHLDSSNYAAIKGRHDLEAEQAGK
jgi:all-trans-retinol dehydrogenase (NAD+)